MYKWIFAFSMVFFILSFLIIVIPIKLPYIYSQSDNQNIWKNYTDSKYGIKFYYPSNWQLDDKFYSKNNIVLINNEVTKKGDITFDKMSISFDKLSSINTLENYSKAQIKNLSHNLFKFKLIDKTNANLSSHPANRILYSHEINNKKFQILQEWTIVNNTVYVISFGTTPFKYLNNLEIFNKIIDSFVILENKNKIENIQSTTYNRLSSIDNNYSIDYPSNWDVTINKNKISLISKKENLSDKYLEKFEIISEKDMSNSQDNYYNISKRLNNIFINEKRYYEATLNNFKILTYDKFIISHHNCSQFTFSFISNIGNTKSDETICLSGQTIYMFIFTSHQDQFNMHKAIISKMLKSLSFFNG